MKHNCQEHIGEHRPGDLFYCRVCGKQFVVLDGSALIPSADKNTYYHHYATYLRNKMKEKLLETK